MNNTDIASVLKAFFDESQVPALFAGAGISAQAGCKMWVPMLQNLANRIDSQDAPTATLMRKHIAANRLELAADLFLQSTEITPQEALGWIAEAIGTPDPKSIQDLACLPFKFAITTNYDQSLHDAYASQHGTNALDAHTFDSLLRNAPFIANKYYVARLHGRLEVPETIVLGSSQYADLLREESYYRSFLFYALTRAQLLFIGFSFLDPGIAHVLKVIRSEYPSNVKNPHLALLPEDATPAIVDEIRRCNINIRRYSGHDELWKAINSVCKTYKKSHLTSTRKKTVVDESFDFAKRYMASCYARTRLGPRMAPLTFSVIEGFVSYAIRNKASTLD